MYAHCASTHRILRPTEIGSGQSGCFGSSSKPSLGGYNARWFAEIMFGLMDQLEIPRAHVVGNSMGGRVAIEMGLNAPDRISALGLLCPAVAWIRRGLDKLKSCLEARA